jgi:hypothetical protein
MLPGVIWQRQFYDDMERLSNIHEPELSLAAFERFPIWTWDDEQEGYHPIAGSGALPVEFPTLFIRAAFTTPSGRRLVGYLIGLDSFFGFGLFVGEKEYLVNLNLPDLAAPVLQSLTMELGGSILPLRYCTEIAGLSPIQGTFERA